MWGSKLWRHHGIAHSWQKDSNPPISWRPFLNCLAPFFFKFCPPPPYPVVSNPHPLCCSCCLVSLAEWVIVPHLMCHFTLWYYGFTHFKPWYLITRTLMCVYFMQQDVRFIEVWHNVVFCWYSDLTSHTP